MNSKYTLTLVTMWIFSFLFGCTAAIELDTNGYYYNSKNTNGNTIKYCQKKLNNNLTRMVPCSELIQPEDTI